MWKKSLLRLYLQKGKLFAPMECIFTTGHCVNLFILPFKAFFILHSIMRKERDRLYSALQNVSDKMKPYFLTERSHVAVSSWLD